VALAGIDPAWTLSGGAALAGFHTAHRETRDLDLFWQQRRDLGDVVKTVSGRLQDAGFAVDALETRLGVLAAFRGAYRRRRESRG
jgi:hypothetical protein